MLLVTGKGHAGQMIDLLGDGRLAPRGGGDPILELDLTYKVQTEPGGIAQVVGMARDFAAGAPLVVVLGDNIFEFAQSASICTNGRRARPARGSSSRRSTIPRTSASSSTARTASVADIVEKAGVVDMRFDDAADVARRRRSLLLPAGRVRRHRHAEPVRRAASSRSRT